MPATFRLLRALRDRHLIFKKGPAMPAQSKAQQRAAGAALAAKRGELDTSDLQGASRDMYETMTESQLADLAETKRKGKPEHANDD